MKVSKCFCFPSYRHRSGFGWWWKKTRYFNTKCFSDLFSSERRARWRKTNGERLDQVSL